MPSSSAASFHHPKDILPPMEVDEQNGNRIVNAIDSSYNIHSPGGKNDFAFVTMISDVINRDVSVASDSSLKVQIILADQFSVFPNLIAIRGFKWYQFYTGVTTSTTDCTFPFFSTHLKYKF